MEEKKLSIEHSVMWNSIGSMFYLGCQWLITVLVVRITGLETAGILSLAMSVCNVWYCFSVYGMRNFQVSDMTGKYQNSTYLASRIVTVMFSFVGCIGYCFIIPYDFEQKACIILYFLFKVSEAVFDVFAGVFQKKWRLDYVGKSMFIRGFLSLATFVCVLGYSKNLMLTIACMMLVCNMAVVLYDIPKAKNVDCIELKIEWRRIKDLLVECFPLVVYTFLSSIIATIPRLFMERIMGNYELGIYGSVATPTLIIQMVATYVFNPFVTLFAEKYSRKEKESFIKALRNCTLVVVSVSIVGLIGGKVFGRWGLELLYGKDVAQHVELLIPLIICTVLTAFSWLLCGVLTAIREFRGLVFSNLVAVLTVSVLSFPLEKKIGMQGASIALGSGIILEIIFLCYYMFRKMNKQFSD